MTHAIIIEYDKDLRLWTGGCDNCHDYYGNRDEKILRIWANEKEERECTGSELLHKMLEGKV